MGVLIDGKLWVRLRTSLAAPRGHDKVMTVGALHKCPRCFTSHADLATLAECIRECDSRTKVEHRVLQPIP